LYNTFPRLFPPGWSLEVEVHFYILAPFLFLLFERLRAGSGLGGAAALMLGVSGAIALRALGAGIERLPHSLLAFLPLFGLGLV
ncbi:hypothetical protein, partial [Salmonella enterica]|uniref:hypothetical protein n=1 Tax=Salmonella enterica TaxID=28901 RepID=UPI00079C65C7